MEDIKVAVCLYVFDLLYLNDEVCSSIAFLCSFAYFLLAVT